MMPEKSWKLCSNHKRTDSSGAELDGDGRKAGQYLQTLSLVLFSSFQLLLPSKASETTSPGQESGRRDSSSDGRVSFVWSSKIDCDSLPTSRNAYPSQKVARIVRINNWQWNRHPKGHRPRVKSWSSRCEAPNQRWAVDQTHFLCGKDGWCHLTAIIDCYTRQIVG